VKGVQRAAENTDKGKIAAERPSRSKIAILDIIQYEIIYVNEKIDVGLNGGP